MKSKIFLLLSLVIIKFSALKNLREDDEPILKLSEIEYTMNNNVIQINSEHVITQISWTKKGDNKFDYLFGVFEGANDPSFSDAVPIAMIKEQGSLNEVNIIDVDVPNSYKYLRYIPPNANKAAISPIKLSGQLKSEINASQKKDFQVTNLPLVSIHVDNLVFPSNKDQEYNCKVVITNKGKIETNEAATIKIRGKSTSGAGDKKPYRIKFETKQQVLGLPGAFKKWTLIANFYDKSLLRNAVIFKVSEIMGFDFTARYIPVDLILNGDYRGTYFLCDQMEVGKERINIDKMEKTDTSEPNLSGGYFLEVDGGGSFYHYNNYKTTKGISWKLNYPKEDDIAPQQLTYITEKFNKFESEVYSGVFTSLDLDTYSKFFLTEEFGGDPDAVWSSCYFYKKRGDDKFYFGPIWDFDLGFDNDQRLTPTNDKPQFAFTYGASAGTMMDFTKTLVGYKTVMESISKTWEKVCSSGLNEKALTDFIDQKKQEIQESATFNYLKWDNAVKPKNQINGDLTGEIWEDLEEKKNHLMKQLIGLENMFKKDLVL